MAKEIDKTFLSIDNAEQRGFLHRDYIAHCFRWSHVVKQIAKGQRFKTASILDLGCGKEAPLLKTLYTSKMAPHEYVGVDFGPINMSDCVCKAMDKCGKAHLIPNYDISISNLTYHLLPGVVFDIITSFEVLEHMTPQKVLGTLKNIVMLSDNETDIFISTPNFNGKAAANHHNEMTQEFLTELFEAFGFEIVKQYGTFASQSDYKDKLYADGYGKLFEQLSEYYDSNVLAVIFAPLYPAYSRNVLHHIRNTGLSDAKKIADVIEKYFDQQQDVDGWRNVFEEMKGY